MSQNALKNAAAQREAGELEAAVETLSDAVLAEPGAVVLWRGLAELLLAMNQPADAVQCLERALHLAPGDPEILNDLGFAHLTNQTPEFGLKFLEQAAKAAPDHIVTLGNL